MARAGQLIEVQCEMPKCYCPKGRRHFEKKSSPPTSWAISADHYPRLRSGGGRLDPWNVRIGHVLCNREDYGWRSRANAMLKKGRSLQEIAASLNGKAITPPHGRGMWSTSAVRKAFVG